MFTMIMATIILLFTLSITLASRLVFQPLVLPLLPASLTTFLTAVCTQTPTMMTCTSMPAASWPWSMGKETIPMPLVRPQAPTPVPFSASLTPCVPLSNLAWPLWLTQALFFPLCSLAEELSSCGPPGADWGPWWWCHYPLAVQVIRDCVAWRLAKDTPAPTNLYLISKTGLLLPLGNTPTLHSSCHPRPKPGSHLLASYT